MLTQSGRDGVGSLLASAPIVGHGNGRGLRRAVAGEVGAAHLEGVDTTVSAPFSLRAYLHRQLTDDPPIGPAIAVARVVDRLVARHRDESARRRDGAQTSPGVPQLEVPPDQAKPCASP